MIAKVACSVGWLVLWGAIGCSARTDLPGLATDSEPDAAAGTHAGGKGGNHAGGMGGNHAGGAVDGGGGYHSGDGSSDDGPVMVDAGPDIHAQDVGVIDAGHGGSVGFSNLGFEEASPSGAPTAWNCGLMSGLPGGCESVLEASPEGVRHLRLAPMAYAYQVAQVGSFNGHVRFTFSTRSDVEVREGNTVMLAGFNSGAWSWQIGGKEHEEGPWWKVISHTKLIDSSIDALYLMVQNTNMENAIDIDDIQIVVEPAPWEFDGHLLMTEHRGSFDCVPGAIPAQLWVPLPIVHGIQVPVALELAVEPPSVGQSIDYQLDELGNFGAVVTVAPETFVQDARLNWKGLVLTMEQPLSALADYYADNSTPSDWLAATDVVQWQDPELQATAQQVCAGMTDPETKMMAVLGWTSTWITNHGQFESLDALGAFETKNGSCTAFANLAAAAGRANALPTRTIANYLVESGAQQTHYIDEFYLGTGKNWRLVEPQASAASLDADYSVVVRVDKIADEGPAAMAGEMTHGIPLRSLANVLAGESRCGFKFVTTFPGAPYCDNRPMYWVGLRKDSSDMVAMFQRARTSWAKFLAHLQTTQGPSAQELAVRASAYQIKSKSDLAAWLDQVEALPDP